MVHIELLSQEIAALEEKIKTQASLKEVAFYQWLTGKPIPEFRQSQINDIEKLCLSAFCTEFPIQSHLVEKIQKSKPIKGIHYSNNLIELSALALLDPNYEKENLKAFCQNASTRDCFIIQNLFPNFCESINTPKNSIDEIAKHIVDDSFPDEWRHLFLKALKSSHDLLDVYIIQKGYIHLIKQSPAYEYITDLKELVFEIDLTIKRIKRRTTLTINVLASILTLPITLYLFRLIFKKWDIFEPLTWIIPTSLFILSVLGWKFRMVNLIYEIRKYIIDWRLRVLGFDMEKIESMKSKYGAELENEDLWK
jgi:hypothetical protein